MKRAAFGPAAAPEYAIGTSTHDWSEVDIAPDSIHVGDVVARAPNDIVVGGIIIIPEPDAGPTPGLVASAAAWRSIDGGPFTQIFPVMGSPDEALRSQRRMVLRRGAERHRRPRRRELRLHVRRQDLGRRRDGVR